MSKHLKRLAASRTLKIPRKEKKWIIKAQPGPHALDQSVPLGIIARDYLKLCDTYKEAKRVVAHGELLVDGVPRKNHKFPVGLMDVVSIPKLKKDFRMMYDRNGKLCLVPIESIDAEWKLCLIKNKSIIKGKKIQIHLHDGRNLLVEKDEYKTGDVLKLNLKDNTVSDVFKFERGVVALITGGSHVGELANIKEIQIVPSSKPNLAYMTGATEFSTITDYVFPVGKTKPAISLPEVTIQ
ncbi:MAG: 30S ribosomal protein S4e [Candidatus Thermoplasmatota archaeon]